MQKMRSTTTERSDASPDDLAARLLETVPLVMRTIRSLMRSQPGLDLTVPQFRALNYVGRRPGASLTALAEHLGLSAPATSRLTDALVTRGLIERATDPRDRRYITLRLQPDGASLLAQAREGAHQALSERLHGLSPAEASAIESALLTLRDLFQGEAPLGAAPAQTEDDGESSASPRSKGTRR